jgi:GTP-binding protein HflX
MNQEKNLRDESNLILHHDEQHQKALLVSVYFGNSQKHICEEHLDELELLTETYGVGIAAKEACPIRKFDASTYLGKGKLEELIQKAQELNVDLVIFDDEISPGQQRNLQEAFKRTVMDRTEVILGVFAQRAHTKEARLQIELARVKYEAPRLKRMWTHLSRQQGTGNAGGGAYLKGEGEKQIEIDRRILKRKIDQLQKELEEVRTYRDTQRTLRNRAEMSIFAIIGYTNAGKSTLLNALTDAGVFVEDKLFATLDTTTRKFVLKNNQEVLLIDTVGFIRKLPHLLVAAFKSTLEEALEADILLHLVDVSHPMAEEQAATTHEVLKELGAGHKTIITVLNKIDQCQDPSMIYRIRMSYPKNVLISALNRQGFDELEEVMIQELSKQRRVVNLRIPQSDYAIVSEVMRLGNILNQDYDENDVLLKVDVPSILANKFSRYIMS